MSAWPQLVFSFSLHSLDLSLALLFSELELVCQDGQFDVLALQVLEHFDSVVVRHVLEAYPVHGEDLVPLSQQSLPASRTLLKHVLDEDRKVPVGRRLATNYGETQARWTPSKSNYL